MGAPDEGGERFNPDRTASDPCQPSYLCVTHFAFG